MSDLTLDEKGKLVASKLREYMSTNRISGTKIAFNLGVSPQTVSNQLVRGKLFSPRLAEQWVRAFAQLSFHINPLFLVFGEGAIEESLIGNTSNNNESFALKRAKLKILALNAENKRLQIENKKLKNKLSVISKLLAMDK